MSTNSAPTMGEDLRLRESGPDGDAEAWLWWTQVPDVPGEKAGVVGGFTATSRVAAIKVLTHAEAELQAHGCTLVIGPMDGNTWRRYRLVTDPGVELPFFMEPTNPVEWPAWWRASGFEPLAEYFSAATDDLSARDARLDGVAARMAAAGVTIRALNAANFDEELSRIYDVSVVAFQDNYLYTPLPRDLFFTQYQAVQSRVHADLILLAEHDGKPVGYVFATPDYAEAQRGESVATVIVKTLAVIPGRANAGLGALLLGEVHAAARRLGFKRAIHALMHETNKSRNLSAHYARTIRRYTLFAKRLAV